MNDSSLVAEIERLRREVHALRTYGDEGCTVLADRFLAWIAAGNKADDFDPIDYEALDEQIASGRRQMARIMSPARVKTDGSNV